MSEKAPAPPLPNIDVDAAFDPEQRQAQHELDQYASTRPALDEQGNALHPATGEPLPVPEGLDPDASTEDKAKAAANAFFDQGREEAEQYSQTPYEELSMPDLARKLGEAEFHKDKTSEQNIGDVLLDKLGAQEAKIMSERDEEHNADRSNNLYDRVMSIKDKRKDELAQEHPQDQPPTPPNTPEGGEGDDGDGQPPESEPPVGNDPPDQAERARRGYGTPFARGQDLRFPKGKKGVFEMGRRYAGVGDVMDWSEGEHTTGPDREIIMRARNDEGGRMTLFVKGNRIYEIDQSLPSKFSTKMVYPKIVAIHELKDGEDLPDMVIGQALGHGFRLQHVDVKAPDSKYDLNPGVEIYGLRKWMEKQYHRATGNPFDDMEQLVAQYAAQQTPANGPDTLPPPAPSPDTQPPPVPPDLNNPPRTAAAEAPHPISEDDEQPTEVIPAFSEQDSRFGLEGDEALKGEVVWNSPQGPVPIRIAGYKGISEGKNYAYAVVEYDERRGFVGEVPLDELSFTAEQAQKIKEATGSDVDALFNSPEEQPTEVIPTQAADVAQGGIRRVLGSRRVRAGAALRRAATGARNRLRR